MNFCLRMDVSLIDFIRSKIKFFSDIRGFMTSHGLPDQARSARYILKDYVTVSTLLNLCIC